MRFHGMPEYQGIIYPDIMWKEILLFLVSCTISVCRAGEYMVWKPHEQLAESGRTGLLTFSATTSSIRCARLCSDDDYCIIFTTDDVEVCRGFSHFATGTAEQGVDVIEGNVFHTGQEFIYTRDLESDLAIRIHYTRLAMTEASAVCVKEGGQLVSLDTLQRQNRISAVVGNSGTYWIGLNDIAIEGVWKWNNGNKFALLSNRYKSQLNNYDGPGVQADCAVISFSINHIYDIRCTKKMPFICESN